MLAGWTSSTFAPKSQSLRNLQIRRSCSDPFSSLARRFVVTGQDQETRLSSVMGKFFPLAPPCCWTLYVDCPRHVVGMSSFTHKAGHFHIGFSQWKLMTWINGVRSKEISEEFCTITYCKATENKRRRLITYLKAKQRSHGLELPLMFISWTKTV